MSNYQFGFETYHLNPKLETSQENKLPNGFAMETLRTVSYSTGSTISTSFVLSSKFLQIINENSNYPLSIDKQVL